MNRKSILSLVTIAALGFSLSACSGSTPKGEGTVSSSVVPAPTVTKAVTTPGPAVTKTKRIPTPAVTETVTKAAKTGSDAEAKTGASAPKAKSAPAETKAQANAIGSAKDYLSFSAFSRKGLIEQLSSKAGDGYSLADATYAVDHITVNWNEQAVKAAKDYLDMSSFSRSGLIEQLSSKYGDGFTRAQATYGVDKAGL